MNIVMGDELLPDLASRYTILGLDWFAVEGREEPIRAYCLIEAVPLTEMPQLAQWQELHEKLMENYVKQNWIYCEQAIEHLKGRWNGELDSFYQNLEVRIREFKGSSSGIASHAPAKD